MHLVEKRIGSQSRHRRKKCVIALCQGVMTLAFEGPQSCRLIARQFCWRHNHIPWTQDRSTITALGEWQHPGCPMWLIASFSCAAEFGCDRRMADSGKRSALRIDG